MNVHQLTKALENNNVPRDAYCLKGGLPNEAYCLDREKEKWIVYYSERGARTSLKSFDYEKDACFYFAKLLRIEL